jgi:amino-acid N-acetyltransferase
VREARFKDVGAIYDVIRENPDEVLPRSFQNLTQNFDRFFVYERGGRILGVISWQPMPVLNISRPDWAIEVVSFSVRKAYQRQGIGRTLLNRVLREIEKYAPDRIIVLTFYPGYFRKFGFRKTSKEKLYAKIYTGCLHCTRYQSPLTCPEVAMEIVKRTKRRGMRK